MSSTDEEKKKAAAVEGRRIVGLIGVGLVGQHLDFWQKKEMLKKRALESRRKAANAVSEGVARKKKADPLKALLDVGHASMVGEREGEEYYKPVFLDKEQIEKEPVSILRLKQKQDIHMSIIRMHQQEVMTDKA